MFNLQGIATESLAIKAFLGVRLIGLGCFYFGAGVIYGMGLIVMVPVLLMKNNKQRIIRGIFLYMYLFLVGVFFARTTMVGMACSILLLLSYLLKSSFGKKAAKVIRQVVLWTTIITSLSIMIYTTSPSLQRDYGKIIDFGFEAFINLAENGELSTKSSDGLQEEHFKILPENIKTYYVGDTQWTDGEHYYMGTDVGYVRLLFYFGISGIILFLLYQYSVLGTLGQMDKNTIIKNLFFIILIYALIVLIKGFVDVAALTFIYLFCNKNKLNENPILQ